MTSLLCDEEHCSTLKAICKANADSIASDLDIEIVGHMPTIDEAFFRSSKTLNFYGYENNGKTSIYKEAAHYGYWLNKLKPWRFESPAQSLRSASRLFNYIDASLIKRVSTAEEYSAEKYDYPVNEHISLLVAIEVASIMQAKYVDESLETDQIATFNEQRQNNIDRIAYLMPDILSSLRYFGTSSLSFALFIEAILRTKYV